MSIKNKDGIINDGVYEIAVYDSDLVLDVEHESTDDGAQIIAFERSGNLNQCFRITHLEDGIYTIIDVNSHKALEADRYIHDDTRKVKTNSYSLKDSMKWRFIDAGDDFWQIENVQYNWSLDLEEDWWENGANICVYEYHGGDNQRFRLIPKEIPDEEFGNILDLLKPQKNQKNNFVYNSKKSNDDFGNIMELLKPQKNQKNNSPDNSKELSGDEIDNLLKMLSPVKSAYPAEIQSTIENLTQQIEELKEQQTQQKKKGFIRNEEQQDKLDRYEQDIMNLMGNILDDKSNNMKSITLCICRSRFNGEHKGIGASTSNKLESFDEDGLSAALEPFTNPRRIKLLKVLIEKTLTASEISQETGLVGGQLYHHLQNLESAGLVERNGDKYTAAGVAQGMLCSLYTAIGGSKLAR